MALGYGPQVVKDDFSYLAFLKRRAVKFYPLHWICLLSVMIPIWYHGWSYNNHALLANFLLLQSWIPIDDFYFSFNAVSWYLSDTFFVSMIFPLLYAFLRKIGKKDRVFVLVLVVCLYVIMMFAVPSTYSVQHAVLYIHPVSRAIEFVIGIFIAEFYKLLKGKEKVELMVRNHGVLVDVGMVFFFLLSVAISVGLPRNLFAAYYWPALACFFLSVMLLGDTKLDGFMRHEKIQLLTRCTFSFFLIHQRVIGYVGINNGLWGMGRLAEIIVAFLVSYLLAQVLYFLVEKKLTQWLLKRL